MEDRIEKNFLLRINHKVSDNLFVDTDKVIEVLADLVESRIEGAVVDRKASRELIIETFKREVPKPKEPVVEKVQDALQEIAKTGEVKKLLDGLTGGKDVQI